MQKSNPFIERDKADKVQEYLDIIITDDLISLKEYVLRKESLEKNFEIINP